MLCTGLGTNPLSSTGWCGQGCGKPVDEKSFAKPIAGQRIGALEISHALRTEGRNGETREDPKGGAQVSRITVDRLGRVSRERSQTPGSGFAGDAAEVLRDR